jgi:hypothetical protein
MLSPFLGMDPYLEGSHWTDIHTQLSAEIARQLTPFLAPKYVALTNELATVMPEALPPAARSDTGPGSGYVGRGTGASLAAATVDLGVSAWQLGGKS